MELVYLWVEDYKNIKKQGFNFSPCFECKYEKDKLTIVEKNEDEYINNFFENNINITAIVGKNGSGKSSVTYAILELFKEMNTAPKNEISENIFGIFYTDEFYIEQYISFDILKYIDKDGNDKSLKVYSENLIFNIYFNYTLDYSRDYNEFYHKVDNYETPILFEPNKKDGIIDLNILTDLQDKNMLRYTINNIQHIPEVDKFFVPSTFQLAINEDKFKHIIEHIPPNLIKIIKHNKLSHVEIKIDDIKTLNYYYIINKMISLKNKRILDSIFFREDIFHLLSNTDIKVKDLLKSLEKDIKVLESKDDNLVTLKIRDAIKFDLENISLQDVLFLNKKLVIKNKDYKKFLELLPPMFDITLENEDLVTLYDLSYGEKTTIRFYYTVLEHLRRINTTENKYQSINIILDEVEQGFHPDWQKRFINEIINVFDSIKNQYEIKKFNFIFLSHSPFLLSDIPKQNIIFLDTYDEKESEKKYPSLKFDNLKKGNCINVTNEIDIKPFGANIHNLLAHGFFMEDGLMGEFAKNKINEIIKKLNKKSYKPNKKEKGNILLIIKSIGEDLLRMKLLDMYYEKFEKDELERERKQLEEQQKEINSRIESIKKRQNDTNRNR